jgi:N-terminal domain of anti-restriction factor ArdC
MNTDQAKQLAENALHALIEALEKGQSEALRNYLAAMGRFHKYSFGNCLFIASQKPDATHVAGFHGWLKLRRFVRKGEKGVVILAPMVGRKSADQAEVAETEQTRVFGFRAAHVFDVSQTEGEPLPEFAETEGDPQDFTQRLKGLTAERGITLDYSEKIAPAKGVSAGGAITLLPGMAPAEEFAVMVHELAHERLHSGARRTETAKTVRETGAPASGSLTSSLRTGMWSCWRRATRRPSFILQPSPSAPRSV